MDTDEYVQAARFPMAERPIPFSGPTVRALLAGRKTVTRSLVTKSTSVTTTRGRDVWGSNMWSSARPYGIGVAVDRPERGWSPENVDYSGDFQIEIICPRTRPGDTLWVRESWRTSNAWDETKPSEIHDLAPIIYAADGDELDPWMGKSRPPIFMPRWASRIILRVTEVRAERVQEITNDGALAEGLLKRPQLEQIQAYPQGTSERLAFARFWDEINGKRDGASWFSNPWVWVIKFEVIQGSLRPRAGTGHHA